MIIAQQHMSLFFFLIQGKDGRDGRDGRDGVKVGLKLRFLKIQYRCERRWRKTRKKITLDHSCVNLNKKLALISVYCSLVDSLGVEAEELPLICKHHRFVRRHSFYFSVKRNHRFTVVFLFVGFC